MGAIKRETIILVSMDKRVYLIDGAQFSSFEEFVDYFSETVLTDWRWNGNFDAFNDILRGGFGTPENGFILRWQNSELSRQKLGSKFEQIVEIIQEHEFAAVQGHNGIELELQ